MIQFKEIETKYNADGIGLKAFHEFFSSKQPKEYIAAAGWDHFYAKVSDPTAFCRHRLGADINQLTFKRKTTENNNYVRTEVNIDLARDKTHMESENEVKALCEQVGYKYNTSIYKNCFIYKFSTYNVVYYICYNAEMKEVGRFLEIEAREDYPWVTENEAWDSISVVEKVCKQLGITAQSRIKRSLFEMYAKETA